MPVAKIPINVGANKDVEEIGLITHGAACMNFYTDSNGNVARAPGIVELCDLGVSARIDGLYWWDRQSKLIAQCNGRHFEITDSSGTFAEISGDTAEAGKKVYYADFGTALYISNGGRIVNIPSSGAAAYVSDVDAPTTVTHVCVLDKYLLALNADEEQVNFSEVLDPDSWAGDWVTPESVPDLTKAIGASSGRLSFVGTGSIEGWRNDGVTPFVKDSAYTVDRGISAPDSFVWIENTWYWLDHERKVVRLNGVTPEPLSLTMNKYIQGFTTVADAIGGYTSFDGRPQYVLTFPTEDKTICFDIYNKSWLELGRWSTGTSTYSRFAGNSFAFATAWNLAIVGDKTTGKIYKLDSSNYQDDGNTHRSMLRTASIHHGDPTRLKRSVRLDFYLKKSNVAQESDAAELMVKWRDDGSTDWRDENTVALGRVGATDYFGTVYVCEIYGSRQYELAISDNTPGVIVSMVETFDWLGQRG